MPDHLTALVAELDTARVREGAVRLLSEVGMAVPSPRVARRLQAAGVRVSGSRVFFRPQAAGAFMDRRRQKPTPEREDAPLRLEAGSHCLYEFCPERRRVQPLTMASLERWTRLVGALRERGSLASACCPGAPSDVPPHLAPLWQQFIGARFLEDPPIYAYSPAYVPHASAMAEVLGRELSVGVHPISPLVLGGDEVELALRLLDEGTIRTTSVAPMPVMGVTAPLDWVAAWAQAVAEAVGTGLALEAAGMAEVGVFAALYVADMRCAAFVYGSAEHALISLTEARVNRELLGNARRGAKSIDTTAKEPGPQAAIEKTAHTLAALLGGYRSLNCVASLAIDEIFSPEQLFIDLDIVAHCERIARGVEARFGEGDVVALVQEGIDAGQYLTAGATLDRFRAFHQVSATFDRRSTGSWLTDPGTELDRARDLAQEAIDGYPYELDEDRQRALEEIIARAEVALSKDA